MKKLMFAAVALATGLVLAEGVQSQNVVGYAEVDGEAGVMAMNGITFSNVTSGNLSISEITPLDRTYGDDLYNDDFIISWYDGTKLNYAYWCDELSDTGKAGWGDSSANSVEKTFKPGEAFWVQPNDALDAPYLRTSGQVFNSGLAYNSLEFLEPGVLSQVSNPTPGVDTALSAVIPWDETYEDEVYNDDFILSWYDGTKLNYAYWCSELSDTGNPGWGDSSAKSINHTFAAGSGFWIQPNDALEGPVLKFANPLFNK